MSNPTPRSTSGEQKTADLSEYMPVPYTTSLQQWELSANRWPYADADAPGETDVSDDDAILRSRPISRRRGVSAHRDHSGAQEQAPVTVEARQQSHPPRRTLRSARGQQRRTSRGTTSPRLSKSPEPRSRHTATQARRGRAPRTLSVGRAPRSTAALGPAFGQEVSGLRAPTADERRAAKAKAERLTRELGLTWHSRKSRKEKNDEITRQLAVADGGYINPFEEQESLEEEVARNALKRSAEEVEEEEMSLSGWLPGEREREAKKRGMMEEEPDIDLYGNIISKNPAAEHTEEVDDDDLADTSGQWGGGLWDAFNELENEPPRPAKKRRSATGTRRSGGFHGQ
ncbi:MAG: hypothetical protein L6R40_003305 [Gallowayella cf. fulva]|nr:MAG: hypothetical protein L6R40_003305 [Xanthomendoza cf. fulva]